MTHGELVDNLKRRIIARERDAWSRGFLVGTLATLVAVSLLSLAVRW